MDSQIYPPVEASGGQEQYYVRSSWHSEACNWESSGQSDIPSSRGIWWPRALLHKVSLTFTVMHQVGLTFWGCRFEIFLWNCDFSGTTYHRDLKAKCNWIWHASNPKYVPLIPFPCISPSQNQQNMKFLAVCLTPPWQKSEKEISLNREKVFEKAWKSAHISLWVCQLQCTMLELCVTNTFWVTMVFLHFWQEGLVIGFWNMV